MNDEAAAVLGTIVARYGREIGDEPPRLEGLLRDLAGEHRREIAVLVTAARAGIPADLLTRSVTSGGLSAAALASRLEEHYALTGEAAAWAVRSWGQALGVPVALPGLAPAPAASGPAAPAPASAGGPAGDPAFCSQCGAPLVAGARFCASCGAAAGVGASGARAPEPAAAASWVVPLRAAAATASTALPVKPTVPAPAPAAPRPTAAPLAVAAPIPVFRSRPMPAAPPSDPRRRRWPWGLAAVLVAGWIIVAGNPRLLFPAAATSAPTVAPSAGVAAGPGATVVTPEATPTAAPTFSIELVRPAIMEDLRTRASGDTIRQVKAWWSGQGLSLCVGYAPPDSTKETRFDLLGYRPSATLGWAAPEVSGGMGYGADQMDLCINNASGNGGSTPVSLNFTP